ncbi:MAG: radical SAM protein [Elusimicrobia bacterium]|nr:radical SAM protein [Elusimicrobiota bacterium]
MRNVELNLGMACNNRCVFCMSGGVRPSERAWVPLERVRGELEHFYREGCRSLGFLGGEPTAHPRIVECVRCARSLGFQRIALCSNGTKFSAPAFVDALISAGVTRFGVSIHSHLAAVEDELTGLAGNFARKVSGIGHLMERRRKGLVPDNVSLNPVLSKRTLPAMAGYVEFFKAMGIDDIRFNFIWPQARVERDRGMIPSYREAMPTILKVLVLNESRWKMHLTFGAVPRCMLRWAGRKLSPGLKERFGSRYLSECDDLPTDVSLRGEERFNWQERKRDMLKTHAASCRRCAHAAACDGVWKSYVALYGLSELVPVMRGRRA